MGVADAATFIISVCKCVRYIRSGVAGGVGPVAEPCSIILVDDEELGSAISRPDAILRCHRLQRADRLHGLVVRSRINHLFLGCHHSRVAQLASSCRRLHRVLRVGHIVLVTFLINHTVQFPCLVQYGFSF